MEASHKHAFTRVALWAFASPVILLMLTGFLTQDAGAQQRNNIAYASVAALKSRIGDARGFEVDAMHVTDTGAACIRYHLRGQAGEVTREQAVVAGAAVARSGARDGRFEKEWNRHCLGLAHDVTDAVAHFF
jgi:hypothetical protein